MSLRKFFDEPKIHAKTNEERIRSFVENDNMLVPWYLILSYAYYHLDLSVVSDELYDSICKRLLQNYDGIEHVHKSLIDKSGLEAGTGFYLNQNEYPSRAVSVALGLLGDQEGYITPSA